MSQILRHRYFPVFRSIVAIWDPTSCQPLTKVWDVQPWSFGRTLLNMRDKLHFSTTGSTFSRSTAYALSVLIQKERLESYIVHKASLSLVDDDRSSQLTLTVPNVNRLALAFSRQPYEHLSAKCFGWVKSQADAGFLGDDDKPTETRYESLWKLARCLQHVVFPHYVRYALQHTRGSYPAEQFLDTYERASSCAVTEFTSPEPVRVTEKFYLVNMANPEKQGDKLRFREICSVFDQVMEWKIGASAIGYLDANMYCGLFSRTKTE